MLYEIYLYCKMEYFTNITLCYVVYIAVQCSDLTEPPHGSMKCNHPLGHFGYQSSCEFTCEEGYMLTGSNFGQLMCEATGHWNDSQPTCEGKKLQLANTLMVHCAFISIRWTTTLIWLYSCNLMLPLILSDTCKANKGSLCLMDKCKHTGFLIIECDIAHKHEEQIAGFLDTIVY